jgi:cyanophycinase
MNGLIALAGSGEYLPVMDEIDRYLLAHCGADGRVPNVVCLATAAGQEGDVSIDRWSAMGLAHFEGLAASPKVARITNRAEADAAQWVEILARADLVYFSGGNPQYLYETLQGTKAWETIRSAMARGAVYAGCSAGAMIIGQIMPDLRKLGFGHRTAFGILPKCMVLPHFDQMMAWRGIMTPMIQGWLGKDEYALGLDEDTSLVGRPGDEWQVMGRQKVYIITKNSVQSYIAGESVSLPT